jgi:CBS domain-containing protein
MAVAANATPLIALDAFVIDTETTGLDPAKARVVQLAAVRLAVGQLTEQGAFSSLVKPDQPIPAAATRVHGIDQSTVADAPSFTEVWPKFESYIGEGVLIGHSVGFDIAVLKRECQRIGVTWQPATSLDVGLLAQIVAPNLAGHSLDSLAAWLDVEIVGRHSALGDAAATARIFLALISRLRARGIRSLAEAVRASNAFTQALDAQRHAGWAELTLARHGPEASPIDTYPYRHRAGEIMSSPVRSAVPETPIGRALDVMTRERISSLLVFGDDRPARPEQTGIVTERDVLRALAEHGPNALTMPVRQVMSAPLIAVPAHAFAYLAIGRMNRLKIRHLGVTDETGDVVGVLSARDLLRLRNEDAIELGDQIEQANDVHSLGLAWSGLTSAARALCREGLSGREVAAIVSEQLCELTRRTVTLAEQSMKESGLGDPPCRYAFVVLGSAGRGESLLAMDQDNALIYQDEVDDKGERWFAELGGRVSDMLHAACVPYCPGGVMAKNPQWRGSLAVWRKRVDSWIRRSRPQDLLAVDIFFDLRGVAGDTALADALWQDAFDAAKGETGFAKLLVDAIGPRTPGLGWFGGLRTEQGRIDLKKHGVFPIVSAARALAVCHHITERSTFARLEGIKALGRGPETDLDALNEAHGLFLQLILRQQIEDAERGYPLGNSVEIKRLTRTERNRLRIALQAVQPVDAVVRDLLFKA